MESVLYLGQRRSALTSLENLAATLHRVIDRKRIERSWTREKLESNACVTAKCYLKLGEWHSQMQSITLDAGSTAVSSVRRGSIAVPIGANFSIVSASLMGAPVLQGGIPINVHQQYYRQMNYQPHR